MTLRGLKKEIRTTSDRIKVLIQLYLPSLKVKLGEYENALGNYWNAIGSLHSGKKGETIKVDELRGEFREAQKAYKQRLENLRAELERLLRSFQSLGEKWRKGVALSVL